MELEEAMPSEMINENQELIEIDGSYGEGGGQILRTSVALSLLTQRTIRIGNVRAKRSKPGLLRQHLTAVRAASKISQATLTGDRLRSDTLTIAPGKVSHGEYHFAVGTAGSAALVFQTVLYPLMATPGRSRIVFEGGTHNQMAPPFDFLERAFLPLLADMGGKVELKLHRHGFYPAGGGCMTAEIEGSQLHPISLRERGAIKSKLARALVANLPRNIAHREIKVLCKHLGWGRDEVRTEEVPSDGPGNVMLLEVTSQQCTEIFTGFGSKGKRSEQVAKDAISQAAAYLDTDVPVGTHLADQLLIPMALAGGGSFCTQALTPHTTTNIELVRHLLGVKITVTPREWPGTVQVDIAK